MRSADAVTLIRVALIVVAAYLILLRFNPFAIILIIAAAMLLDAVDGYFAIRQASGARVGFGTYVKALSGDQSSRKIVREYRGRKTKQSRFGPRIDVAGDRAVEYIMWAVYTVVGIIPFFVIVIVILRHSFVDAVMAAKGTSSKMKTKFAQVIYSSNIFRGGINVVKFLAFSYLALAYISGYPLWIAYVLVAILVIYILVRGAAEMYEAYSG